jgi:thymidylate synthase
MNQYLDALKQVLESGTEHTDRTGTGTISLFGLQQRYDLRSGFPAVTTKRLAWRSVVSELLWFIEGSGDENCLREILYGDRDSKQDTIWTANAQAPYWQDRARYQGDLGRIYGVQWRHWRTPIEHEQEIFRDEFGNYYDRGGRLHIKETDQLQDLIANIKRDPYSRRHILTAWNPGELADMALPPCHVMAQFSVRSVSNGRDQLSCQMYQRSCDMFLGVPFNVASYSLLTHMIAQVCDLAIGEFVHVLGDAHIYLNHVQQVKEQLKREPLPAPQLWLNPDIKDIDKFTMADIRLVDYQSYDAIKAEMAV